ncbi:MAG: hypothetical protein U0Y68_16930 [Blastocatellia bacterium]
MTQENLLPSDVFEETADTVARRPSSPVLKLATPPESKVQRDPELVARLQKEITILQMELEKARQEITRYEMLLRNAKQREIELRAELRPRQN